MKYILALILSLYCLGQPIAYAQSKTEPTKEAAQSTAPEKSNVPAVSASERPEQKSENKNPNTVPSLDGPNENVSFDNSAVSIAKEANDWAMYQTIISGLGFILICFATWFAWGAWQAGRKGVEVTETIGKKQTKAYLSMSDASFVIDKFKWPILKVNIKNTGNSPANNVGIRDLAYKIDIAVWKDDFEITTETFSDAVSEDYRLILPDIMSGETFPCENASIIPGYNFEIINSAMAFQKSSKKRTASVEIVCNLEYTDVFEQSYTIPCRFFAVSEDGRINGVSLDVLSAGSKSKVKKLYEAYKNNTFQKRVEAAGLRTK